MLGRIGNIRHVERQDGNRPQIGDLNENFNLVYPELTIFYSESGKSAGTTFACSESTFYRESTQAFLKANYTDIDPADKVRRLGYTSILYYSKTKDAAGRLY